MEELDIEWFDQPRVPNQNRPLLTIQRRGSGTLNRAAIEALGNPEAVLIGFDRGNNVIAFKGVSPDVKGAYILRHIGVASTAILSLRAFSGRYGLEYDEARRYLGQMQGDVLTFVLEEGVPVGKTRRGPVTVVEDTPLKTNSE